MIYVSSDWHGCPPDKIKRLLDMADFGDDDFLFVLGDVIDRGEHSAELLRLLMYSPNMELLMGNHEVIMLANEWVFDEVTDESVGGIDQSSLSMLSLWQMNGGDATISSLSRVSPEERADMLEYLRDCPLYDSVSVGDKDFLLVHAGLGKYSSDKRMSEYERDQLLCTRPSMSTRYSENFVTVVGHTPTLAYGEQYRGRILRLNDTIINIDAGAAMGLDPCLLRLDDMKEFYL